MVIERNQDTLEIPIPNITTTKISIGEKLQYRLALFLAFLMLLAVRLFSNLHIAKIL